MSEEQTKQDEFKVPPTKRPLPVLSNEAIVMAFRQITDRLADVTTRLDVIEKTCQGLSASKGDNHLALAEAMRELGDQQTDIINALKAAKILS